MLEKTTLLLSHEPHMCTLHIDFVILRMRCIDLLPLSMRRWNLLVLLPYVLLCLVSGGYSGRTSSYVRTEFPSTDIPLDSEWFSIPKGYNAPQQVSHFVTICQFIIGALNVYSA
jgi:hypothetical protein